MANFKSFFIILIVFLGSSFSASADKDIDDYQLEGYIKIRSIQEMGPQVIDIMKEMNVPKKHLMASVLFLSMIGHPKYNDFVENKPTMAFAFRNSLGKRRYVIGGKLKKDAVLRRTISALGWKLVQKDGWDYIAKDTESISELTKKDRAITPLLDGALNSDVKLEYLGGKFYEGAHNSAPAKWWQSFKYCKKIDLKGNVTQEDIIVHCLVEKGNYEPRFDQLPPGIKFQKKEDGALEASFKINRKNGLSRFGNLFASNKKNANKEPTQT